ncbi:hypothetical protein EVAR_75302_1 [Eumeta japonica]|uniref:Uncharacterized protein n=1 Tax=Eumeta variegata TaxID=151549 RepID=A0A4C1YXG3_EUMVA|nr:hypothetical protein EVAR_75302_1 [Eumeta japonica]
MPLVASFTRQYLLRIASCVDPIVQQSRLRARRAPGARYTGPLRALLLVDSGRERHSLFTTHKHINIYFEDATYPLRKCLRTRVLQI